ncbi:MAG TPA: ABC transporter ATP-binding protein [Candidatus Acidoferrales bacterium]|nr:ABC transporter ATP-binding protein [Candidatus Acidoferrales bacterium]
MSETGIIEIRGLHKTYRVGRVDVPALRGVDLTVGRGEFLSIVGPSGSGKSTLFHIIGGLTPPTSGEVRVDGQDLSALSDAGRTLMRKRTVGFVFQKFNLLPNLTARDNIAVARHIAGLDHKPAREFDEVLNLLGIAHRLDHKPAALSGGEQQRVAIARAIVKHPAILLADEPTGNLDTENSRAVLEVLRDLNQRLGQTILMITHNPEAAEYGHSTVHMRDGRIVERR